MNFICVECVLCAWASECVAECGVPHFTIVKFLWHNQKIQNATNLTNVCQYGQILFVCCCLVFCFYQCVVSVRAVSVAIKNCNDFALNSDITDNGYQLICDLYSVNAIAGGMVSARIWCWYLFGLCTAQMFQTATNHLTVAWCVCVNFIIKLGA